jgi:NADH-quinone oxidoreductase subunit J
MHEHILDIVILVCLVLSAAWAVLSPRLLRAVVALALASISVTLVLFRLDSPLAAVFELSVCAGLISAVFISTISLSALETEQSILAASKQRIRRYWCLPPLLVLVAVAMTQRIWPVMPELPLKADDVREVLWTERQLDLFGQIAVLLAGAFGVVVLFKQSARSAPRQAPGKEAQKS